MYNLLCLCHCLDLNFLPFTASKFAFTFFRNLKNFISPPSFELWTSVLRTTSYDLYPAMNHERIECKFFQNAQRLSFHFTESLPFFKSTYTRRCLSATRKTNRPGIHLVAHLGVDDGKDRAIIEIYPQGSPCVINWRGVRSGGRMLDDSAVLHSTLGPPVGKVSFWLWAVMVSIVIQTQWLR